MRAITDYIPHRGKMLLIDELIVADDEHAIALTTPRVDNLFATPNGIPALVGIEYIAQTVASYSCAKANKAGEPEIGLLLGSRRYKSHVDFFPLNKTLTISAKPLYIEDDALGMFAGTIVLDGVEIVSATLNVFQPDNIGDYFAL